MNAFPRLTSPAMPLLRANVDTDAIIPSREMTRVSKHGLGEGLFAAWRYLDIAARLPDPAFVLNDPRYARARILLAGENFGCGSSREHAIWALAEYGFHAILAPSFNPIFRNNCFANGVAPVELPIGAVTALVDFSTAGPAAGAVTVDIDRERVEARGLGFGFTLDPEGRDMLLTGLDAIGMTLGRLGEIAAFRDRDRIARPWIYPGGFEPDEATL